MRNNLTTRLFRKITEEPRLGVLGFSQTFGKWGLWVTMMGTIDRLGVCFSQLEIFLSSLAFTPVHDELIPIRLRLGGLISAGFGALASEEYFPSP